MSRRIAEAVAVLMMDDERDAAALQALVAGCGGWSGVITEWRAIGGRHEVLACLWEVRGLVNAEAEAIAAQLGAEEEFVRRFVWAVEANIAGNKLAEAAELGGWLAEVLSLHLGESDDPVVQAGAAWWRERWEVLGSAKSVKE